MAGEAMDAGCGRFAAEALLARVEALARERDGVRLAEDIECLHRMRVATRRLRAALAIFAGCLPDNTAETWRRRMRRLTRALGAARDLDVQLACVEAFARGREDRREQPGLARLLLRLRRGRDAQQTRVVRALKRLAKERTVDEMAAALGALRAGDAPPSPALFALAAEAVAARLAELFAFAPYVDQPDRGEELHAMRIAAKRLRYTLEVFAPLYPGELKAPLKTVKSLQELLGDLHDCDVWLARLPDFLAEERRLAVDYQGHARNVWRLAAGLRALEEDRRALRAARYAEFAAAWAAAAPAWEELRARVNQAGADAP